MKTTKTSIISRNQNRIYTQGNSKLPELDAFSSITSSEFSTELFDVLIQLLFIVCIGDRE